MIDVHIYPQFKFAEHLEDVLCLTVLVSQGILPWTATVRDAQDYWDAHKQDCTTCPFENTCMACIINA